MATGLNRNHLIVLLTAALAAATVALVINGRGGTQELEISAGQPTPGTPGPVEVYITGAVAQPGVYQVAEGDRVVDVLYQAGGPAPDADLEAINLSIRLRDEHHIVVPRIGEPGSGLVATPAPEIASGGATSVNINTATAAELDELPGIGEAYSQRIVDSRASDGPFTATDELVARHVVPRSTYEKIKDLITAGP